MHPVQLQGCQSLNLRPVSSSPVREFCTCQSLQLLLCPPSRPTPTRPQDSTLCKAIRAGDGLQSLCNLDCPRHLMLDRCFYQVLCLQSHAPCVGGKQLMKPSRCQRVPGGTKTSACQPTELQMKLLCIWLHVPPRPHQTGVSCHAGPGKEAGTR